MDAAPKPTIGPCDDALTADDLGKAHDPLGDEVGMLDYVGRMAHHARQDGFMRGQLDVAPNVPFVLVADITRLERIGIALNREHKVDDVAHRQIGDVWPVPASPAQMEADAVLGQALDRMVESLDP